MELDAPVQYVKGIGPQRAEGLAKLGVRTAEDLLLHLPMRYEDRRSFARVAGSSTRASPLPSRSTFPSGWLPSPSCWHAA